MFDTLYIVPLSKGSHLDLSRFAGREVQRWVRPCGAHGALVMDVDCTGTRADREGVKLGLEVFGSVPASDLDSFGYVISCESKLCRGVGFMMCLRSLTSRGRCHRCRSNRE